MKFTSISVLCPFYRDETKNTIRCEGLFSEALSNNFESVETKRDYKNKCCCSQYTDCKLYSLLESKYK